MGVDGGDGGDCTPDICRLLTRNQPASQPTYLPFNQPTHRPSNQPTDRPTNRPTDQLTNQPTGQVTYRPTDQPQVAEAVYQIGGQESREANAEMLWAGALKAYDSAWLVLTVHTHLLELGGCTTSFRLI